MTECFVHFWTHLPGNMHCYFLLSHFEIDILCVFHRYLWCNFGILWHLLSFTWNIVSIKYWQYHMFSHKSQFQIFKQTDLLSGSPVEEILGVFCSSLAHMPGAVHEGNIKNDTGKMFNGCPIHACKHRKNISCPLCRKTE